MGVRPMKLLICGCGYFAIIMVSMLYITFAEKTTGTIIGKTVMTTSNSFKSCRIPTAENTIYQLMKSDREHVTLLPNSPVQGNGTVVHIECQGANRGTTSWFGQDYMVCYNGEWYPPGNLCIKFCPPLNLLNSVIECTLNDKPVSCQENVRPGTVADNRCKAGYNDSSTKRNERNICLNTGKWSYQFVECFLSCEGIDKEYKSNDTDLMEVVYSPWTAGVYVWSNTSENFVFVCSASIVGTDIIVTAARCVQENGKALDVNLVRVAVGKTHVDWNDERDIYSQTLKMSKITDQNLHSKAAKGYMGLLEMFKSVSFLLLKDRVEFNSFVRAICPQFKRIFKGLHMVSKSNMRYLNGTVTGWDKSGKRISFRTTFYNNADCRKLISELDEDDEEREQLESEIKKFGSYCTDRGFPESFLGTGAIYYDEGLKANRSVGALTRLFKSFSIFMGPRSDEVLDEMTRFYSNMIDKNYRGKY
ncbi:modular serine protease isoform X2 [Nilaparvata lugens]|uniref:modular serine protease isoform X2 n=1 Tax=Nilaparvata lugens TaxID=108931 RepID=UPI000B97D066|nr:modular serine protease isoform X2 [Nilaparvata lugens]